MKTRQGLAQGTVLGFLRGTVHTKDGYDQHKQLAAPVRLSGSSSKLTDALKRMRTYQHSFAVEACAHEFVEGLSTDTVPHLLLSCFGQANLLSLINAGDARNVGASEAETNQLLRPNNAALVEILIRGWPYLMVITTCPIDSGQEILMTYGDHFWTDIYPRYMSFFACQAKTVKRALLAPAVGLRSGDDTGGAVDADPAQRRSNSASCDDVSDFMVEGGGPGAPQPSGHGHHSWDGGQRWAAPGNGLEEPADEVPVTAAQAPPQANGNTHSHRTGGPSGRSGGGRSGGGGGGGGPPGGGHHFAEVPDDVRYTPHSDSESQGTPLTSAQAAAAGFGVDWREVGEVQLQRKLNDNQVQSCTCRVLAFLPRNGSLPYTLRPVVELDTLVPQSHAETQAKLQAAEPIQLVLRLAQGHAAPGGQEARMVATMMKTMTREVHPAVICSCNAVQGGSARTLALLPPGEAATAMMQAAKCEPPAADGETYFYARLVTPWPPAPAPAPQPAAPPPAPQPAVPAAAPQQAAPAAQPVALMFGPQQLAVQQTAQVPLPAGGAQAGLAAQGAAMQYMPVTAMPGLPQCMYQQPVAGTAAAPGGGRSGGALPPPREQDRHGTRRGRSRSRSRSRNRPRNRDRKRARGDGYCDRDQMWTADRDRRARSRSRSRSRGRARSRSRSRSRSPSDTRSHFQRGHHRGSGAAQHPGWGAGARLPGPPVGKLTNEADAMLAMQPRNSSASWGEAANEAAMFLASITHKSSSLAAIVYACRKLPLDRSTAVRCLEQSRLFEIRDGPAVHLLSEHPPRPPPLPPLLEEKLKGLEGPEGVELADLIRSAGHDYAACLECMAPRDLALNVRNARAALAHNFEQHEFRASPVLPDRPDISNTVFVQCLPIAFKAKPELLHGFYSITGGRVLGVDWSPTMAPIERGAECPAILLFSTRAATKAALAMWEAKVRASLPRKTVPSKRPFPVELLLRAPHNSGAPPSNSGHHGAPTLPPPAPILHMPPQHMQHLQMQHMQNLRQLQPQQPGPHFPAAPFGANVPRDPRRQRQG